MKKIFHIHFFSRPLMAKYVGFSTRDVICECRCGERKMKRETRRFSSSFSAPTFWLSNKEFNEVLTRTETEFTLTMVEIEKKCNKLLYY